jgi:transcriptional regulator with XRE-family HTH domain
MTGADLKAWRGKMSQAELASRLGVSRRTYGRWELDHFPLPGPLVWLVRLTKPGDLQNGPNLPV